MSAPCLFCDIAAGKVPAHRVAETDGFFAFLDIRPVFEGHTLVIPKAHIPDFDELPPASVGPLFVLSQQVVRAQERGLSADGAFVALNHQVSQSVAHLHVHVVPRRKGDGLRGFFWPRRKYASDEAAAAVAERLRGAMNVTV